MREKPLRVYLDSGDYSALSNPKQRTPELDLVRDRLLQWSASNEVEFWYSGAHLSEMAPLDAQYADAATARADLLVALCGRRALISFDRLVAREVACIADKAGPPADVYSLTGDWFPEVSDIVSPVSSLNIFRELSDAAKAKGHNRSARRALKKQHFKHGQLRKKTNSFLAAQENAENVDDILRMYPMREQDALVLSRYCLGQATAQEADAAFLESLRDPRWMMRWFSSHADTLSPISEWLRTPAQQMAASMADVAAQATVAIERATELRKTAIELRQPANFIPSFDFLAWRRMQDNLLSGVASRLLESQLTRSVDNLAAHDVDEHAPGLSSCIRAIHTSVWNSVGTATRKPKNSDFVDGVHAMYAPYVDVFRIDSYMAPLVQSAVKRYGTIVVPRLRDLVPRIEPLLKADQPTGTIA